MSHNLRAPVANILGIADILQTIDLDKEDERKAIDYLAIAVKKLDDVVIDLNDILNIKHEVSEKKTVVKFSEILDDVTLSIDYIIKKEEVAIISNFSETDGMVTLKSYLHSIFFNLISNSIKYRQQDIAPVIEITSRRLGNKIQLLFKDNGLGIDLKRRSEEVFGIYKRFHDHVEGKGLGLYMVKTQVETLGGTIGITSEVNKGTEIQIEFLINE